MTIQLTEPPALLPMYAKAALGAPPVDQAEAVRGRELDCGHFLAEEAPDETLAELLAFFGGSR